ncbi:dephospho-CoA kinase [Patescibacteria group bacterium]|nr:dephospho-CoA kinase [Patescibacteria group bacterium]
MKFNKTSSLFVGRWQPFHEGHKTLIETVLKEGKPVIIAIRDTEISHDNPFSTFERWSMIQKALAEYRDMVKIIVIPDIDEICYGRDVGYGIRKIDLEQQLENISGTKTRKQLKVTKTIIWLTGQSGSGKTTIANILQEKLGGIILDGDEMRSSISTDLGFNKNERETHNLRVARLAKVLSKKTPVIVSVIAPFEDARKMIDEIAKPFWVYVERNLPLDENKPYQIPLIYHVKINSDTQKVEEQVEIILSVLEKFEFEQ